ncbi:GNAT family N-acetyltransferase [Rhizobium sp. SG2393]|uniref:GNAT family N-acetyltransferase n=1 Tax=Rhizobium sp. SG2393 TaxID=3276279 RepID=UPI00366D9EA6
MREDIVTIRRALPDDADAFRAIRLEALRCEPSFFASSYDDWACLSEPDWKQRLADPVFIAFQRDEPVGIMGVLLQRAKKMAHRATIIMVYVRKALRGTDVARDILSAVVAHARQDGVRQLELTVSAENPAAIRFYTREGFMTVGRIPGGFLEDGQEIDDIIMVRRLTA